MHAKACVLPRKDVKGEVVIQSENKSIAFVRIPLRAVLFELLRLKSYSGSNLSYLL